MSGRLKHRYIVTLKIEPKKDGDCGDISCLMMRLTKDVKEIKVREINVEKVFINQEL